MENNISRSSLRKRKALFCKVLTKHSRQIPWTDSTQRSVSPFYIQSVGSLYFLTSCLWLLACVCLSGKVALDSYPCNWWWSPRPCQRRAQLDRSGRWQSNQGWWRRAWRGCFPRHTAPRCELPPHRRQWWSACRCHWCSVWGHREGNRQSQRYKYSRW